MPNRTNAAIQQVLVDTKDDINRFVKTLVSEIANELKLVNPVDTGWARANWIVQIGTPFRGPTPQEGRPSSRLTQGDQKISNFLRVYEISGVPVYISNNVPYINPLDRRGSRISGGLDGTGVDPQFVERTIDRVIQRVSATFR